MSYKQLQTSPGFIHVNGSFPINEDQNLALSKMFQLRVTCILQALKKMVAFKLGIGKEGNGLLQTMFSNGTLYNDKPKVEANCC